MDKTTRHSKKTLLLSILLPIVGLGVIGGGIGIFYGTNTTNIQKTNDKLNTSNHDANENVTIDYNDNTKSIFNNWGINFTTNPTHDQFHFILTNADTRLIAGEWALQIFVDKNSDFPKTFAGAVTNFVCHRTIVYDSATYLIGGLDFWTSNNWPIFENISGEHTLTIEDGISFIGSKCFYKAPFYGDLVIPQSVTLLDDNSFESFGFSDRGTIKTHNLTIQDGRKMGWDVFKSAQFDGTLTLGNHAEQSGVTSNWGGSTFYECNFNNIICDYQNIANHVFNGTDTFKFKTYESGNHLIKLLPSSNLIIANFSPLSASHWIIEKESAFQVDAVTLTGDGWGGFTSGKITCMILSDDTISINSTSGYPLVGANISIGSVINYQGFAWKVTTIDNAMFYNGIYTNTSISGTLTFNTENLTTINQGAFRNCSGLTGNLVLPQSVTHIGAYAFNSTGFTGTLTLPDKCSAIDQFAFGDVPFNGTLTLPIELSAIGEGAFYNCGGINTVVLPENLHNIGATAFFNMHAVTNLYVEWTSLVDVIIGNNAFASWNTTVTPSYVYTRNGNLNNIVSVLGLSSNWVLHDPNVFLDSQLSGTTSPITYDNKIGDIQYRVIAPGEVTIKAVASTSEGNDTSFSFANLNVSNTSFTYDSNTYVITEIDEFGFYDPSSPSSPLSGSLTLSNKIKIIDNSAFNNCSGLTTFNLSGMDDLIKIGNNAFRGCSNLTGSLILPEKLNEVGNESFYGCSSLNGTLQLDNDLASIGNGAFQGCTSLYGDINLKEIHRLGTGAFANDDGFRGGLILSPYLDIIPSRAFYNCINLTGNIDIPEYVSEIGDNAFYNCRSFDRSITFSKWLTRIGNNAFWGCSGLRGAIDLPPTLELIGQYVFYDCTNINVIYLGDRIRLIDSGAFENMHNVTEVHLDWTSVASTSIQYDAFLFNTRNISNAHYIYLPDNSRVTLNDLVGINKNIWSIYKAPTPPAPTKFNSTPIWIALGVLGALVIVGIIIGSVALGRKSNNVTRKRK